MSGSLEHLALSVGALLKVTSLPPRAINSLGEFVFINDLLERDTKRWVIQRKAKVIGGILSGLISLK